MTLQWNFIIYVCLKSILRCVTSYEPILCVILYFFYPLKYVFQIIECLQVVYIQLGKIFITACALPIPSSTLVAEDRKSWLHAALNLSLSLLQNAPKNYMATVSAYSSGNYLKFKYVNQINDVIWKIFQMTSTETNLAVQVDCEKFDYNTILWLFRYLIYTWKKQ